uniref:Transmembrane protein n=1 Tax=Panagrolaimus sp. ES5 TaxID=591445 RepID=A0AC34GDD3_9BILA
MVHLLQYQGQQQEQVEYQVVEQITIVQQEVSHKRKKKVEMVQQELKNNDILNLFFLLNDCHSYFSSSFFVFILSLVAPSLFCSKLFLLFFT